MADHDPEPRPGTPASGPARKRLRTSHACDACRSRKIRCDGNRPCATCAAADNDCAYGSEASSRGKTDLVLDGVIRIERVLQELNSTIQQSAASTIAARPPAYGPYTGAGSPPGPGPAAEARREGDPTGLDSNNNKAAPGSPHTSTTDSVLQWPHFDALASLRSDHTPAFHLEQARPALATRLAAAHPYVTADDVEAILASFQRSVNAWFPAMSLRQLDAVRTVANTDAGAVEDTSVEACVALLTMALGCAGQVASGLDADARLSDAERRWRAARRQMGDVYFDAALKRAYTAHLSVSSAAAHCLLLVALYFAFLARPLQAWEFVGAAAAKCLMLLYHPPEDGTHEERERTRRVFWSCYILESDYMDELSVGPVSSAIAHVESSVPLPGSYNTHTSQYDEERSSLYLLACIGMRRLLNRVHQLLYTTGPGSGTLDTARFPRVVADLQHQLDEWRSLLPPPLAFALDTTPPASAASGFLRQRYLACRSLIYRPYLVWLLGASDELSAAPEARSCCKACLDACLMYILNLRGFPQTVLVDTWICSLSMACAMLLLLAACRVPSLRSLVVPDVLMAGDHLKQLLQGWQRLACGPRSPGVDQSIRIIHQADRFIKEAYLPTPRDCLAIPRRPSDL